MTKEEEQIPSLEQAREIGPLFRDAVRKAAEYGWSGEFFGLAARLVFDGYSLGKEVGLSEAQEATPTTESTSSATLVR